MTDVDELVATAREAGLPVELRREGDFDGLPSGVSLAVYRVVQESLTNVRKHAGAAPDAGPDPPRGRPRRGRACGTRPATDERPRTASGHGLIGMRERVRLYGGTLEAGADDAGGFAVHASIPVGDAAR